MQSDEAWESYTGLCYRGVSSMDEENIWVLPLLLPLSLDRDKGSEM